MKRRDLIAVVLVGALLVPVPAASGNDASKKARDRKAPKITKAAMKDNDGNGLADRVALTYSERVWHRRDADGTYPFKVNGYSIRKVKGVGGARKLVILLEEADGPDTPRINYKKTKTRPVRDKAGNQARKQAFKRTTPLEVLLNLLTVIVEGAGTVTSLPPGIDCGDTCSAEFEEGSVVALAALGDVNAEFASWSGDCTGEVPACMVTMDGPKTVTATFTDNSTEHVLTVTKSGTGTGTVASVIPPGNILCGETCTATFTDGATVTLLATPDVGSSFAGWMGACTNTEPTCMLTITDDTEVEAMFLLGILRQTI